MKNQSLRQYENRVYSGKQCTGFDYRVRDEKNKVLFEARWRKGTEQNEWNMTVVLDRTRDADSQVYNFGYVLPKAGMSLEMIAAIGLKYFQLYLKEELQRKMEFDFVIGELTKGM